MSDNYIATPYYGPFYSGMALQSVSYARITNNTISGWEYGLTLASSQNNRIWNNFFIHNNHSVFEDQTSNGNFWNSSTTGNYWSDFMNNSGYPTHYVVEGPGDGVDWHPFGAFYKYIAGDVNGDRNLNANDITFLVNYFKGGTAPPIFIETPNGKFYPGADANGDCRNSGSDVLRLVGYLKGTAAPPTYCPVYPPRN